MSPEAATVTPEAAPRWLDEREQECWRAFAGVIAQLRPALDAQLKRDAGITHYDYTVLSALSESPGRTRRMRELAFVTDGSLSRLSQVVSRLEKQGWVRRRPDPDDGRTTLASLTEEGWDKVVATAPGHVEEVRRLVLDPLTPAQVDQLTVIARRMTTAHADGDGCATPAPRHTVTS